MEEADDDVGMPASRAHVGRDQRSVGLRRPRSGCGRVEAERIDVGVAEECNLQAARLEHRRLPRGGFVGPRPERDDPGGPHGAKGLEQSLRAEVAAVVVRERQRIEAGEVRHRLQAARRAAEREFLGLRRPR